MKARRPGAVAKFSRRKFDAIASSKRCSSWRWGFTENGRYGGISLVAVCDPRFQGTDFEHLAVRALKISTVEVDARRVECARSALCPLTNNWSWSSSTYASSQPNGGRNHQTPRNRNTAAEATKVNRSTGAVVGGICLGGILFYSWRWYQRRRRIRNFHLTTEDLSYSDRSAEQLVSQHLIDLNGASVEQIGELGIAAESLERLLENRPYRNKLELISRMVLSQEEYSAIKDKVSVAEAGEPVKIA
jgi:hypothetical protein